MTGIYVRLHNLIAASRDNERGAAMAEYGVLIALIFVAVILTVGVFGESVVGAFETTNNTYEENRPANLGG